MTLKATRALKAIVEAFWTFKEVFIVTFAAANGRLGKNSIPAQDPKLAEQIIKPISTLYK